MPASTSAAIASGANCRAVSEAAADARSTGATCRTISWARASRVVLFACFSSVGVITWTMTRLRVRYNSCRLRGGYESGRGPAMGRLAHLWGGPPSGRPATAGHRIGAGGPYAPYARPRYTQPEDGTHGTSHCLHGRRRD